MQNGHGVAFANGRVRYLAAWPDAVLLDKVLQRAAQEAALEMIDLGTQGIRIRRAGDLFFAFNYSTAPVALEHVSDARFIIGSPNLAPADVAVWHAA